MAVSPPPRGYLLAFLHGNLLGLGIVSSELIHGSLMFASSASSSVPTAPKLPLALQRLIDQLEAQAPATPAAMRRLLLEAQIQADWLEPWADVDHPVADSYGRRLIYQGDRFEVMVMSWAPGDMSAIHDHGHTQWGAVQVFGPAEHATFRQENDVIITLARMRMTPGEVVGVSHQLVHQMGNPTDTPFLSLHIYGHARPIDNVTGDARLFDLHSGQIQRINGGVFFDLPPEEVAGLEPGPAGDFPTRLRHLVELLRRMRRAGADPARQAEVQAELFAADQREDLLAFLGGMLSASDHHTHSPLWRVLNQELQAAARLQRELEADDAQGDAFRHYAELYDALVCQPCLEGFMAPYLTFLTEALTLDWPQQEVLSVGCGTGLVEVWLRDTLGVRQERLYGMDYSAAMIEVAQQRIHADVGDVRTLDPAVRQWDLVFSGLNVYQYLAPQDLAGAIARTAAVLRPGGYFIGDFITPDHIRWYPNVLRGADEAVISLRTPRLIEVEGRMFQESDITNLSFLGEGMHVSYAGKHRRFLPPLHRVRQAFERAFGGEVRLLDAVALTEIPEWADSCASTRYVVVARKG